MHETFDNLYLMLQPCLQFNFLLQDKISSPYDAQLHLSHHFYIYVTHSSYDYSVMYSYV